MTRKWKQCIVGSGVFRVECYKHSVKNGVLRVESSKWSVDKGVLRREY